ncbi:MAG: tRNA pseudouridine(38-40) synthase TruA [Verrucomicrobia bacterium]|nr:tRNA pseudouridine(38-40) synthase TruA [Verrucomicrobiota bacterium]
MAASSSPQLSRWKCTVAYDGTQFSGWQSQPDANAVQDFIERRLAEVLKVKTGIQGSGRTDSGVHARAQVFHFDADWPHSPAKLLAALRVGLPPTLQVTTAKRVPASFHSRFSAKGKIYHYEIHHRGFADPFSHPFCWSMMRTLDIEAMRAAAARLVGKRDFRAYSAASGEERESTVRTLEALDVQVRGRRVRIVARGDGFLYKMVRSLVGALVDVGAGRLSPDDITAILATKQRTHRVVTAPPEGLFLVKVFY